MKYQIIYSETAKNDLKNYIGISPMNFANLR